jgi:hypothetical protein
MKKIIPLILAIQLLLPVQGWAVIAVVQSVGVQGAGVSSITTANITTTGANLIICDAAYYLNGNSLTGITDSKGNTYSVALGEIASAVDGEARAAQFYKENAAGGASHNFTITFSGDAYPAIACKEVSGALTSGALDKTATKADNSGDTGLTSSTTLTTAQANELLAGGAAVGEAIGVTDFTAQGGFTENVNLSHVSGGDYGLLSASKVVSATGAYDFPFDISVSSNGTMGWVSTWKASGVAAVVRRRSGIMQ